MFIVMYFFVVLNFNVFLDTKMQTEKNVFAWLAQAIISLAMFCNSEMHHQMQWHSTTSNYNKNKINSSGFFGEWNLFAGIITIQKPDVHKIGKCYTRTHATRFHRLLFYLWTAYIQDEWPWPSVCVSVWKSSIGFHFVFILFVCYVALWQKYI